MTHHAVAQSRSSVAQRKFNTINRTKVPNFFKFDQISIHSNRDISHKSETDTHTHTHRDKVCRSHQSTDCDNNFKLHDMILMETYQTIMFVFCILFDTKRAQ